MLGVVLVSAALLQPATNATMAIRAKLNSFFIMVVSEFIFLAGLAFLHSQAAIPTVIVRDERM